MTFRLCFMGYKKALKTGVFEFLQNCQGTKLKLRQKKYRDAEARYIRRKNEMKLLWESFLICILKKTFAHESDLNSLSDSDDDSFLGDIYASNYPITATGMFFPGPYMPLFPQIPDSTDVNLQNKHIFHNNG
uniref:Uncharacterized protein n=1 Tax=Panagrolaimus superbus TaxID=310955 RepID=A0A914Z3U5_9BILA